MDKNAPQMDRLNTPLGNIFEPPINELEAVRQYLDKDASALIYKVKAGDTLGAIIAKRYQIYSAGPRYKAAEATLLYFNPAITNPDKIFAGQLIRLHPIGAESKIQQKSSPTRSRHTAPSPSPAIAKTSSPASYTDHLRKRVPNGGLAGGGASESVIERPEHSVRSVAHNGRHGVRPDYHRPMSPEDEELFWTMAWLAENYNMGSIVAGTGLNTWGNIVSAPNRSLLAKMKALSDQFHRDEIGRFEYARRVKAAQREFVKNVGPFDKLLFNGQSATEATYIKNTKAFPAHTFDVETQIDRLHRMGNYAKHGGLLLTAGGVYFGCDAYGNASTRHEKNEIFVETVAGTFGGLAVGAVLGFFFVSTPVGWVTAVAIGAASAASGWAVGSGSKYVYNTRGKQFDLAELLYVDEVC